MALTGKFLEKAVRNVIPALDPLFHKGQAGRIGVIGGCKEYTGAPYFSAISSLKAGADLSHVFCYEEAAPVIKAYSPELIVHPVLDSDSAVAQIEPWINRLHAVVIGPGLGRDSSVFATIQKLIEVIKSKGLPLVIDADGLWFITQDPSLVCGYQKTVLTPNAMEFKRLYETVVSTDLSDDGGPEVLLSNVAALAARLGHVTICRKGSVDLISDGNTHATCDEVGSSRRCGGQGDLLSGSLGTMSYWAHSCASLQCAPGVVAAYGSCLLTRRCANRAFTLHGRSTTTTDLIQQIHASFSELYETPDV